MKPCSAQSDRGAQGKAVATEDMLREVMERPAVFSAKARSLRGPGRCGGTIFSEAIGEIFSLKRIFLKRGVLLRAVLFCWSFYFIPPSSGKPTPISVKYKVQRDFLQLSSDMGHVHPQYLVVADPQMGPIFWK